ncbi:MAG TPA: delta-60 repeat domain-containing protein [Solirubrobacterales bacterium]|nr:delta-60 repeat domain-containing protein [Solirubrobacterales bacterium]
MRGWGDIRKLVRGAVIAALFAFGCLASPAAADTLLVQPDGKLVLTGSIWPEAGALARLNPDGSLDPSFGQGGFAIDRRLPGLRALALEGDGRIVAAAVGGSQLARYLPNGAPDPAFAGGGVGGTDEVDQPHFVYGDFGPTSLLLQPGGGIVVAGNRDVGAGDAEAWVRRYGPSGGSLQLAGFVPRIFPLASSRLADLVELGDGSLVGAGWGYDGSAARVRSLLARFLPGSGTAFDPSFGGGVGLAHPAPAGSTESVSFTGLVRDGDRLLAAGASGRSFALARFDGAGNLDQAFGNGGFVVPAIVGPSDAPWEQTSSRAEDLAVMDEGDVVLGGGTSQWSKWEFLPRSSARHCVDCPQPLLARVDSAGQLDPGFGNGGLLHLTKPDGTVLEGAIEQVTPLASGRFLVNGPTPKGGSFVARLNPDGSFDPSFGQGGLVVLAFPCKGGSRAELRRAGCLPSARVKVRVRELRGRHPAITVRVAPVLSWSAIRRLTLTLPGGLRPLRGLPSKARIAVAGGSAGAAKVHVLPSKGHRTRIALAGIAATRAVRLGLPARSLRPLTRARRQARKLRFRIAVEFSHAAWLDKIGEQTVVRAVG